MREWIDQLREGQMLPPASMIQLLDSTEEELHEYLTQQAAAVTQQNFGDKVYIRGLIEVTNYCKNDCLYCGIRRSNHKAERYRLSREEILECCHIGYPLGFRTFVLQGGEDGQLTDDVLTDIVASIRKEYPDCAITLSLGERPAESYQRLFDAGANRYLLRHETADPTHYAKLHPPQLTLADRMACLQQLKDIGYQVGTGFMVGSPHQTTATLVQDLAFIHQFQPQMVGIGPFLPHCDTPFGQQPAGRLDLTLKLISILRLMLPKGLLPATTALASLHPTGRERGLLAGANVIMPNLSPCDVRSKYMLYNNKLSTGAEAAESIALLKRQVEGIGRRIVVDRGDFQPTE